MDVYWYRFEDFREADMKWDDFDRNTSHPALRLCKIQVEKVTPKGVRLSGDRFVLRDARKRYACPTIEEARESFLARKKRQAEILRHQLKHVEDVVRMIDEKKYQGVTYRKIFSSWPNSNNIA